MKPCIPQTPPAKLTRLQTLFRGVSTCNRCATNKGLYLHLRALKHHLSGPLLRASANHQYYSVGEAEWKLCGIASIIICALHIKPLLDPSFIYHTRPEHQAISLNYHHQL